MDIELTASEMKIAEWVATRRQILNQQNSRREMKQSEQTDEVNAYAAELAFCKHKNVFPDLEMQVPGVHDCKINGYAIDIKLTHGDTMNIVRWKREKPIDYFAALKMVGPTTFRYYGVASKYAVFRDEHLRDIGSGPYYAVPLSSLRGD